MTTRLICQPWHRDNSTKAKIFFYLSLLLLQLLSEVLIKACCSLLPDLIVLYVEHNRGLLPFIADAIVLSQMEAFTNAKNLERTVTHDSSVVAAADGKRKFPLGKASTAM